MQTTEIEHADDAIIVRKNYETDEGDLKLHNNLVLKENSTLKRLITLCFVLFIITSFPYTSIYSYYYNQEAINYNGSNTNTFAINCLFAENYTNNNTLTQNITKNYICPEGYTWYVNSVVQVCMHNFHYNYNFVGYNRSDAEIEQIRKRVCNIQDFLGNEKTYQPKPILVHGIFIYCAIIIFILYLFGIIIEIIRYKYIPKNRLLPSLSIACVISYQVINFHIFARTITNGFTFFDVTNFHQYPFLVCVLSMSSLIFVRMIFSFLKKIKKLNEQNMKNKKGQ